MYSSQRNFYCLHRHAHKTLRAYTVKYWIRGIDEIQTDGELMEHNELRCLRQSAILSLYCTIYVSHTRDTYKGCFVLWFKTEKQTGGSAFLARLGVANVQNKQLKLKV